MSNVEPMSKSSDVHEERTKEDIVAIKRDPHGFPLRPQPTEDPLGQFCN